MARSGILAPNSSVPQNTCASGSVSHSRGRSLVSTCSLHTVEPFAVERAVMRLFAARAALYSVPTRRLLAVNSSCLTIINRADHPTAYAFLSPQSDEATTVPFIRERWKEVACFYPLNRPPGLSAYGPRRRVRHSRILRGRRGRRLLRWRIAGTISF